MNTFLHHIGLDFLQEKDLGILENRAWERGIIFNGYSWFYKYVCLGHSGISFRMRPVGQDGNKAVSFVCDGYDAGFRSNTYWTGTVTSVHPIEGDAGGIYVHVMADMSGKGWSVPVTLLHADVLPSLSYGDDIYMQIVCFPKKVAYFEFRPEKGEIPNSEKPVAGTTRPSSRGLSTVYADETGSDPRMVCFAARILQVRRHQPVNTELGPKEPLVVVTVETSNGLLDIVHALNDVSEPEQLLMKPGNTVHVHGWLSADVAIGEYQGGAVFDLHHNLRLLADCIRKREFGRAVGIFSNQCRYYSKDDLRAQGPEAVVAALNAVGRQIGETDYDLGVAFGEIHLSEDRSMRNYRHGEKCLVFLNPEKKAYSVMFASLDEDGKIGRLQVEYEFDEGTSVLHTDNYQGWCYGLSAHVEAGETVNEHAGNAHASEQGESTPQAERFYAAEDMAAQVHGDASRFSGEPFWGFGDIWNVVVPNFIDRIHRYMRFAEKAQGFYTAGSHVEACYLDFPDCDAPVRARMAVVKKDENKLRLETAYPVFVGHPAQLDVAARFDWDNGVCGFISTTLANGLSADFFVPGYGRTRERFVPGETVCVNISGLALSLDKPPTSFTVECGPFYERRMKRFLEENPDKTAEDFKAPVVRIEGCVLMLPTDTTCFYSLLAPVREIWEVDFEGHAFYRLLMPIARSVSGEDISAYVYASKERNRELHPAVGDMMQCHVWLCADICEYMNVTARIQ